MTTAADLAKKWELLRLQAYRNSGDVWTIGYGHTGKDVYAGLIWTEDQANAHLIDDIGEARILLHLYSPGPYVPGADDALTDFVFNLGSGHYRTSTLRHYVDDQNWHMVKSELLIWDHMGGRVLEGLKERRQEESDMIEV